MGTDQAKQEAVRRKVYINYLQQKNFYRMRSAS